MFLPMTVSGIAMGCIYGLVALGFSLTFRAMGLINFAQGEFLTIGALVGYSSIVALHLPYPIGIIIGLLGGGIVAVLIDQLIYAPLRRRDGVESHRAVFATIAMLIIVGNSAKAIWGSDPLSYPEVGSIVEIGGVGVATSSLLVVGVAAVVMILLNLVLFRTSLGIAMRAYADDASTASLMGIVGRRVALMTSYLSGALGALGGVLLAQIYYASFDLGVFGLKAFAAAILGGLGSVSGAVLGGLLLGLFEVLVSVFISTAYRDAIVFSLIIAVLLIAPMGLFKS